MGCCESRLGNTPLETIKEKVIPIYIFPSKENKSEVSGNKVLTDTHPKLIIEELPKENVPIQINYIRKLNNCYDSEVYLLSNNVVLKKYPNTRSGLGQFNNEVEAYRIMKGTNFVLNMLSKNVLDRSFTIPYIDGHHTKNSNTIAKVNKYLLYMKSHFGFERIKPISWTNVIVKKDIIYLIDFGSLPIIYTPGGKTKWKVHKHKSMY